jgi:periplasmic protein TonB
MFDSVLGHGVGAPGRPVYGAAVSVGLHAFLLAVALVISRPVAGPLPLSHVHFPSVRLPPATPPGGAAAPRKPRPPLVRPRITEAVTTTPPAPLTQAPPSDDNTDGRPGNGGPGPGTTRAVCPAPPCSPGGTPGGESPVLLLGPEMLPPRFLSGPEPGYPAAAAFERVGGTVLLRCTVTDSGSVERCTVLKSAPLLDEAALRAVTARRYAPALYEGRPVSVWMVLPVRFVPP